jgi:hypothetical protein
MYPRQGERKARDLPAPYTSFYDIVNSTRSAEEGDEEMIVLEVAGAIVILALLGVATWMAIVGLEGVLGAIRLQRCHTCGHLGPSSSDAVWACAFCRVDHTLHAHLAHARVHHRSP